MDNVRAIVQINYSGPAARCLISIATGVLEIIAKVGDPGAETFDPDFGDDGVLSVSGTANVSTLISLINTFDGYEAVLVSGDQLAPVPGIYSTTIQAPGVISIYGSSSLQGNALIGWDTAKVFLKLDESQKDMVEMLINSVSDYFEKNYLRRVQRAIYSRYLEGKGSDYLVLPDFPVTGLELRIDTAHLFGDDTIIPETDIDLDADSGIVYLLARCFPIGRKTIKVEYTAGFETIPFDLQQAALESVSYNLKRLAGQGALGVKSVTAPSGGATVYELSIPFNARQIFESYRGIR